MFEVKYKVNNGFVRNEICYAVIKDNEDGTLFRYWDNKEGDWIACCDVRLYTGLKDKNGKEIYEGDILHDFSDELPMIVEWDVTLACFKLCSRIDGCLEFEYKVYEIHLDGLEIIGNIYENQELLEGE